MFASNGKNKEMWQLNYTPRPYCNWSTNDTDVANTAKTRCFLATRRTIIAAIRSILWCWIKKSTYIGLLLSRVDAAGFALATRLFCKHFALTARMSADDQRVGVDGNRLRIGRAHEFGLRGWFKWGPEAVTLIATEAMIKLAEPFQPYHGEFWRWLPGSTTPGPRSCPGFSV